MIGCHPKGSTARSLGEEGAPGCFRAARSVTGVEKEACPVNEQAPVNTSAQSRRGLGLAGSKGRREVTARVAGQGWQRGTSGARNELEGGDRSRVSSPRSTLHTTLIHRSGARAWPWLTEGGGRGARSGACRDLAAITPGSSASGGQVRRPGRRAGWSAS